MEFFKSMEVGIFGRFTECLRFFHNSFNTLSLSLDKPRALSLRYRGKIIIDNNKKISTGIWCNNDLLLINNQKESLYNIFYIPNYVNMQNPVSCIIPR